MSFEKFEDRPPSAQTAVDIFSGKWASDLSKLLGVENTGFADLFLNDPRPGWAAQAFGKGTGRIDGMRVLELGPLEGGHSYQLERLGAKEVLGIDTNVEAYLKCLIVKELLDLKRCRFMLGNGLSFMQNSGRVFDLIFCSGILYHMPNPIELIKACCAASNRVFVWTHYFTPERGNVEGERTQRTVEVDGFEATYFELAYPDQSTGTYWGGNVTTRAWMDREQIFACFRHFGLDEFTVFDDTPDHPNGAAISFSAERKWSSSFVRLTTPP